MRTLVFLLLAACGGSQQFTWGDLSSEVSLEFCLRSAECGFTDSGPCYRHSVHHLCQLDATCGVELPDQARADTYACVEATHAVECGPALYWGVLPEECDVVWTYQPETE